MRRLEPLHSLPGEDADVLVRTLPRRRQKTAVLQHVWLIPSSESWRAVKSSTKTKRVVPIHRSTLDD